MINDKHTKFGQVMQGLFTMPSEIIKLWHGVRIEEKGNEKERPPYQMPNQISHD